MSVQLTIRQKVIRIVSSAVVGGLSVSFLVGEAVDNRAHLLSKWEIDPQLAPSDFRPLAPIRAASQMIQSEEWRRQVLLANGATPESLSAPAMIAEAPADSVKAVQAAPVAAVEAPAAVPVVAAAPVAGDVKTTAQAEVREPAGLPVRTMPGMEPVKVAAPEQAVSVEPELARDDKISPAEVEGLFSAMRDATNRLGAYPQKTRANQLAAASIQVGTPIKDEPAQPVQLAAAEYGPQMAMISGGEEPESAPRELHSASAVQPGAAWKIPGQIVAPSDLPKGHFEIGLYSKIDQDGIPIGFPLVQQILPSGVSKFELKVPNALEKGFLYGEFVATKTGKRTWIAPPLNPWLRSERQVAELIYQQEDSVTTVAAATLAAAKAETFKVTGSVGTLFARPGSPIPQEEVLVKVRGRKESTRTNKDGSFSLDLAKVKGTVYLEFLKPGYHPSVVAVPTDAENFQVKIELASREAVDQVARMLGLRQITTKGVFIGRATGPDGSGLRGMSVQASVKAEGPFYFTDEGLPTTERKTTSSDGRFLFLNLEPGTGYMEASINNEPIAPFQFSTVEGGEMVNKQLTPVGGSIKGRVFNPVASDTKLQALSGARVRVEGAADYAVSDSYGAFTISGLRWMKGERIFLELSSEKFNNHRYSINPEKQKTGLNLYAFPAVYISRLARSMDVDLDPYAGLVMGKVGGNSVRIDALADHSPVNAAKDFYFDAKGKLRGSHTMTDPDFGTYVIFNVPKGRTILQGNDSAGTLRYSEAVVSSPSSVSVIME